MATRQLYHFTALYHLGSIHANGLNRGELAGTRYKGTDVVSLTKSETPTFAFWGAEPDGLFDKLRVRVAALVEEGPQLMRWRDALREYGCRSSQEKRFDPMGDGHNWLCYFGTIPPDRLLFQVRNGDRYEAVTGEALTELAAKVRAETENWASKADGSYVYYGLKKGVKDSFLLDGRKRQLHLAEVANR